MSSLITVSRSKKKKRIRLLPASMPDSWNKLTAVQRQLVGTAVQHEDRLSRAERRKLNRILTSFRNDRLAIHSARKKSV